MSRWVRILVAAPWFAATSLTFAASPPGAASCLGCHSSANDSPVPQLGKFTAEQIVASMQAFRSGKRASTVMDRIAKGFSDEEIEAIARWYAGSRAE